ncbi:hypothetical protein F5141DRAFT_1221143 [Pisolithus sp. B1]|nr:hypothetical protein F5141DRAFT_1221143 [Pisolithus sp. B1]
MTGNILDIDEESGDWDTVDTDEQIPADTNGKSIDWDTVDMDSEHDFHNDDHHLPIMTDPQPRLREQFDIICAIWTAVIKAVSLATERTEPIAYHTSILSGGWILELLSSHPERIRTELGVHKHVFRVLVDELQQSGYSHSKYVTLQEQLGIFLYIAVTGLTIRHIGECFQ